MRSLFLRCRLVFLLAGSLSAHVLSAAIIQWDGGGADGQWNTASNWVGDILPVAGDDVILNNIFLAGTYTVTLPAGPITTTVNTLTITPAGANTITLILPITNTADPGLLLSGPGDALVLNSNAWLRNSSGAATGSGISITNTFRINNGAHYVHNTSRGNAAIVSQLSVLAGTELGVFEFDVPLGSYILSLSGRNYGTLILSSVANGGAAGYLGSGASPCNVRGDLIINAGVSFSLSMSANFIIARNFDQSALSFFDLQTSVNSNTVSVAGNVNTHGTITETGTGISLFLLNGTIQQLVDATSAAIVNLVEFRLNNPAGASLLGSITVSYLTSIQSGNFLLNNFNFFTGSFISISSPTMTTNHIVTNGSGEFLMAVNAATPTVFPVGPSVSSYNPVTINSPGSANFGARVVVGINPPISFPTFGINRTWNIRASTGNMPNVTVTFQYASADANANATQPQDMEILMYSGLAWSILSGNTNITPGGADPAWTITTLTPMTVPNNSTPYALGVDGGWVLPLECIISSNAKKINDRGIISWTVNSCAGVASFEPEKLNDAGIFESIGKIIPNLETSYEYNVGKLPVGRSQYRVRINKNNGETKYSNIVTLISDRTGFSASIQPTIIKESGIIILHALKNESARFYILNSSGQLLKQWETRVMEGENQVRIDPTGLPAGVLFLHIQSGNRTIERKFIKE